MNKQQLASKIWDSANKMRSKIEAHEYKDYILGFIFYKYLSDSQVRFLMESDYDEETIKTVVEEDVETVRWVQENMGYFISYDNLFSTWIDKGKDFDVSDVTDALSAFSRLIYKTHRGVFDKVFHTLETGLSKLGDTSGSRTKAIAGLLELIKDIPMDGKQDYDVLGFIYEYLISMFAANAGKKAGEFYTPQEVSILMSEIIAHHLQGQKEIKIYDPTSGSGSLLINIGHSISKYVENENNIKYYAQELKENTYNLTRMNLVMRGIKPSNIVTRNGDTLEEDWPYFDESDPSASYDPLYVDAVVSNPPYSQSWDPAGKENEPRYARFGLAPKTKADYAFLLHDLYHLKPNGIMAIVLPHGVLFRGGEEGNIRKNLIENNHVDAVIGLPSNVFFGTGIPTVVMILKQKRDEKDILIIDASKGFIKEGKNNKLRASDIKKIVDTYIQRESTEKYSKTVSLEEIRKNEYNLNIPRYVDSSKEPECFDIYASMFGGIPKTELKVLSKYWEAFPTLKETLFKDINDNYLSLSVEDTSLSIKSHPEVIGFRNSFKQSFRSFDKYLYTSLIENINTINISKEKNIISEEIFNRLKDIPLIDKYNAYQLLDDNWRNISTDLEIIQSEGFKATKQVDPNLVLKKQGGKEVEIQDGYLGHILPFELVQNTVLQEQYNNLKDLENKLLEIPGLYEELLDELTEEEKESDIVNDTNDAFVLKNVTKSIKVLKKANTQEELDLYHKLLKVEQISKNEKQLKSQIKTSTTELHLKTKEVIENLTDDEVEDLLNQKWIIPLTTSIYSLVDLIITALFNEIKTISTKYDETYVDIQKEIKETENLLCSMIDELTGSEFDMLGLAEFKTLLGGD